MDNEILDQPIKEDIDSWVKAEQKKLFIISVLLAVLISVLAGLLLENDRGTMNNVLGALYTNIIGFTIVGFFLGALFAFIPYKSISYARRYVRASLLVILTLQLLLLACLLLIGVIATLRK